MGKRAETSKLVVYWRGRKIDLVLLLAIVVVVFLISLFFLLFFRHNDNIAKSRRARQEVLNDLKEKRAEDVRRSESEHLLKKQLESDVLSSGYDDVALSPEALALANKLAHEESQKAKEELKRVADAERATLIQTLHPILIGDIEQLLVALMSEKSRGKDLSDSIDTKNWEDVSLTLSNRAWIAVLGRENGSLMIEGLAKQDAIPQGDVVQMLRIGHENGDIPYTELAKRLSSMCADYLMGQFLPKGEEGTKLVATLLRSFLDDGKMHHWQELMDLQHQLLQSAMAKKTENSDENTEISASPEVFEKAHRAMRLHLGNTIKIRAEFTRKMQEP